MDLIDAAVQRDIVLLLAVIVVALAGAVALLFRTVLKVYQGRVERAEALTDRTLSLFDKLEEATKTSVAVARDAVDELKRRP